MKLRRFASVLLALAMLLSATTVLADGGKINLLYTFWGSAYEKAAQEGAITAFMEQNPDIEVEALHIPSSGTEYIAKLTAMAAAGQNPDMGYMDVATAFVWAKEGKFYNIFDLMEEDPDWGPELYVDDIFYRYDVGKSFGSTSSINPRQIFYNVDAFTEAGIEPPPTTVDKSWTWDQFVETAKLLTLDVNGNNATSPEFDPEMIMQYGIFMDCSDLVIQAILLDSNGADLLSEDGATMALDAPEAVEVYQALYDLIYVHHVCPSPVDFKAIAQDLPTALKGRQGAMAITGQWILLDMAKMGFNFDLGVLPKFKEPRNIKDAGTRVVFSNARDKEAAWKLFKFLASPAGALSLYKDGLWMPVLKEWYENEELYNSWATGPAHPASYKTVVADSLFNGTSTPSYSLRIANINDIQTLVRAGLEPIWNNSLTGSVEDALKATCASAQPAVMGYNPENYHNSHYHKYTP